MKTRWLSALVLAPPVLLAVYLGSPYSDLLFVIGGALLAWEWARLTNGGRFGRSAWLFCGAVVTVLVAYDIELRWVALAALALGAASLALFPKGATASAWRRWYLAGLIYIPLGVISLIWLRGGDEAGLIRLIWLLLVVWATDIAAYAAGKSLGGPKLLPSISPKKTWAGLGGGLLAAAAVGAGAGALFGLSAWPAAGLGAALAVVAQAGDFLESWIKRQHGAKDSSGLIPGHGGLFDRVDGLILAGVFLAGLTLLGLGPFA